MARTFLLLLAVTASLHGESPRILVPEWSGNCGVPVLKDGAADLVKASFKKLFRRTDFTKIDVVLTPFRLVEDGACLDGAEMVLWYNHDGGEDWMVAEVKPTWIKGGLDWKFTMEGVVPCIDHYFKITLVGKGKFLAGNNHLYGQSL